MKNFIYRKRYLLIVILEIIIVSYFSYLINKTYKNKYNNDIDVGDIQEDLSSKNGEENSFTEEQVKECWNQIQDNLIGKWIYKGGEFEGEPYIILESNNELVLYGWGETGDSVVGSWNFNEENYSIKFTFNILNEFWSDILQDQELKDDYNTTFDPEAIISYSYEEKSIEFSIGYYENPEYFEECKIGNYFINVFNVLLYKEEK